MRPPRGPGAGPHRGVGGARLPPTLPPGGDRRCLRDSAHRTRPPGAAGGPPHSPSLSCASLDRGALQVCQARCDGSFFLPVLACGSPSAPALLGRASVPGESLHMPWDIYLLITFAPRTHLSEGSLAEATTLPRALRTANRLRRVSPRAPPTRPRGFGQWDFFPRARPLPPSAARAPGRSRRQASALRRTPAPTLVGIGMTGAPLGAAD